MGHPRIVQQEGCVTLLIAFMDDLMFLSRIREAAAACGMDVRAVREPAGLIEACRAKRPALVFVDLDSQRLPVLDGVRALRANPELSSIPVVGFLGHTQIEQAKAAEAAGCTRVLTRGAFVNEMRTLILQPPTVSGRPEPTAGQRATDRPTPD
jgi:CheY-like chemotaxis protein